MSTRTRDRAYRVANLAGRIETLVDQQCEDYPAWVALERAAEALEPVVTRLEAELSAPTKCECGRLAVCDNCICCTECCECTCRCNGPVDSTGLCVCCHKQKR